MYLANLINCDMIDSYSSKEASWPKSNVSYVAPAEGEGALGDKARRFQIVFGFTGPAYQPHPLYSLYC